MEVADAAHLSEIAPDILSAYDLVFLGSACHDADLATPVKELLEQLPVSPAFKLAGFATHASLTPEAGDREQQAYMEDLRRARRELAEIRARDLRFSKGETEVYLSMALGPELARESAALLERRTEGWIVGLHLATLWLRGTGNPAEFLNGHG